MPIRAMGDTVLSTPLLRDFKRTYPDVTVDVLVQNVPSQVIKFNPNVNDILIYPNRKAPISKHIELLKEVRNRRYTMTVDILSTPASAILSYFSGVKKRIGYDLRFRSWAYTEVVPRNDGSKYSSIAKYELLRSFNVSLSDPIPEIFPQTEDYAWAEQRFQQLSLENEIVGAIAPWSIREWRRWSNEGWIRSLGVFANSGVKNWILFAVEPEREFLREIENCNNVKVYWGGAPDLLKASALMRKCQLMFCGENGLKHVAVASGLPSFTVYIEGNKLNSIPWDSPNKSLHSSITVKRNNTSVDKVRDGIANFIKTII